MQKLLQYLKGVRFELAKVSWPTQAEVVGATTLVVVLSIAVSIVVKLFDIGLSRILGIFLQL